MNTNLEFSTTMVGMTIVKPLIQLREIVSKALSSQTNSGKSFRTFFIETMELYLTNKGRINFTTMAKLGKSCESRFRQNFKKSFDWLSFNKSFFGTDLKMSARDIFDLYRTRFQIEFFRDAKQFTGLTHCHARNKEALSFAFNMSLSSINVARAYARQENINLSVGSTKTLLHNAAMMDRFIAMSGKRPNLRLNDTVFKELLFCGVRAMA